MNAAELVSSYVQALLPQAVSYFAVAGLLYVVVWRVFGARFAARRIQKKARVDGAQIKREVLLTLLTLAIGAANAMVILSLHASGHTQLSDDTSRFPAWQIALSFVGLLVYNDAWFYWWHRLLHHPFFFRHVHAAHHKSVDVNPFSSYAFHGFEGFILGAGVLPLLVFVPLYLPVVGALQVVGLAKNLESHLGYEFMPAWYARVPPFRWFTTSTYHNLHHSRFNGNYGLTFRFWDKVCGTEVADTDAVFLASRPGPTPEQRNTSV
jgi:sterol desaturase/sphingolipid hydroxylase (fatty acid hydroxylase superfamily)